MYSLKHVCGTEHVCIHCVVPKVSGSRPFCPGMLAGVVFFQFSRIRMQSIAGSAFLTPQQQEWSELSRMVLKLQPPDKTPVPKDPTRR